MAKEEILEKLMMFLQDHPTLNEECHVVYLMVEIRKILDHENTRGYPLLRFYCDWTVHTEKDRITDEMRTIMEEVFVDVKVQIENPAMTKAMSPVMKFAYMENLELEMRKFFEMRGMSTGILDTENWISFVSLLVRVLENQPINNPTDDITLFSFIPAAPRCVRGVVVFKRPINGYDHYNFGNAY